MSSLEDFAIEIIIEPEKNFNNAMGQESLTRFDQPKRSKKSNKKRKPNGENLIVANNSTKPNNATNTKNTIVANNPNKQNNAPSVKNTSENKPATPRKPIIITKNENKKFRIKTRQHFRRISHGIEICTHIKCIGDKQSECGD